MSSSPASPTDGTAMNWLLEHVLTNEETHEHILPLRTIYALNANHSSANTESFKALLIEQISNLPTQPCTLPPVFLKSFVSKCFPQEFEEADFDQALTALDYIRDLEVRRERELEKAIRARGPHDKKVLTLKARAAKLEHLYARTLIGLRRWTMIAELKAPTFNKYTCMALLNTLYPIDEKPVNTHMNAQVLAAQRQALWTYITKVEKRGISVLDSVCKSNGGWEAVSNNAGMYCRIALDLIQRAEELARPVSYGSFVSEASTVERATSIEDLQRTATTERRGSHPSTASDSEQDTPKKSTLEKIVKGLQKLGSKTSRRNFYSSEWNSSAEDVKRSAFAI